MKQYTDPKTTPLKFHKLYIWLLNPLAILCIAAVAAILLGIALHAGEFSSLLEIPAIETLTPGLLLWIVFGLVAATLLFYIITEVLLVKRKKAGVNMLIFSYVLSICSGIATAVKSPESMPITSLIVSVCLFVLISIYYWKRRAIFS
jgi:hypothetical protein